MGYHDIPQPQDMSRNAGSGENGSRNVGEFGENGEFGESGDFGDISPRLLTKCSVRINQFREEGSRNVGEFGENGEIGEIFPRLLTKCYE